MPSLRAADLDRDGVADRTRRGRRDRFSAAGHRAAPAGGGADPVEQHDRWRAAESQHAARR